ncbi:cupin domain-containing protein [Acinetobacter indicus]|uniref:cupin domain-containing protein n=2 Tax=Acinetobacter indicus TaxID=756892 RepID=UPI002576CA40|nr:cupin domain-containing protein [Acinetobacter indicus]MDM1243874.1 cupin domain-containing protein [Acinetobacter indicus]MDM1287927.1 cupin domain-containing protein [Acinetobacter indicus]
MEQLARLEDLPVTYVDTLKQNNLVPLWPSLRNVLPPVKPVPLTQAIAWKFQEIKPLLIEAGELTPIEKAERRVLVLANPGHGLDNMRATSVIYLGMQLLLPKEWAPAHRHTPNAVRLIVEGENAYTTVEGQKCPMSHGDLILTPSGLWHEHGHDGDEPVIWLDVLDLPLVYYMEASFVEGGECQPVVSVLDKPRYGAGLVPTKHHIRAETDYPMLRYPWAEAKHLLIDLAKEQTDAPVQVAYVNPETGEDCQKIIGYSALMIRPNETVQLPPRSAAQVFHVIEGQVELKIDAQKFALDKADTACAPCFAAVDLINHSSEACFIFVADEAPIQKKLGLYSVRERR